eukprot:256026-Chlamydomonas_euryale.AAC.2
MSPVAPRTTPAGKPETCAMRHARGRACQVAGKGSDPERLAACGAPGSDPERLAACGAPGSDPERLAAC